MVRFKLNGKPVIVQSPDNTPLLWVVRDELGLTGTKFGCGIAQCGACTVHDNGVPIRSCVTPVSAVKDHEITTIEGLSKDGSHPLQVAWEIEQVPQCGYCQSGQIMQAAQLLQQNSNPSDADINQAMSGNLCRCMSYVRIRKAIKTGAKLKREALAQEQPNAPTHGDKTHG